MAASSLRATRPHGPSAGLTWGPRLPLAPVARPRPHGPDAALMSGAQRSCRRAYPSSFTMRLWREGPGSPTGQGPRKARRPRVRAPLGLLCTFNLLFFALTNVRVWATGTSSKCRLPPVFRPRLRASSPHAECPWPSRASHRLVSRVRGQRSCKIWAEPGFLRGGPT